MRKTFLRKYGGGGGIRTHEAIADLPVFKTGAFNQALPPLQLFYKRFRALLGFRNKKVTQKVTQFCFVLFR